ncbi:MAG: hypothetical protein M9938_07150 [Solirubrobacterales bacterium]|nr:hypothetical protein [Solirubrobacterales bacterium]
MARSRKSAWLRDELILCLDLYRLEGASPSKESRENLSQTLRAIPIEPELADDPEFRSYSSVGWKLANFATLDPATGSERSHGAKGDRAVWSEFWEEPERLAATAANIIANIERSEVQGLGIPDLDAEAPEGRVLTMVHHARERNSRLVKKKKASVLETCGRLECEACRFDFSAFYGERGQGFIECHHLLPVSQLSPEHKTKLTDLALGSAPGLVVTGV